MAKAKKSEVKIEEEAFNGCGGREVVMALAELHFKPDAWYEAVDLDKEYWQNDRDTLVLAFDRNDLWRFGPDTTMQYAIGLAEFVRSSGCDEFDTYTIGTRTAIRFWWD